MTGYIKYHRQIEEHWLFEKKPLCPVSAWFDLIAKAQWKETKVKMACGFVTLNRGELVASERELAARWGWSRQRVVDFLQELKNDDMIQIHKKSHKKSHQKSHLIINNYDDFQGDEGQEISHEKSHKKATYPPKNTDFTDTSSPLRIDKNITTTTNNNYQEVVSSHGNNADYNCLEGGFQDDKGGSLAGSGNPENPYPDNIKAGSLAGSSEQEKLKSDIIATLKGWNYSGIELLFKKYSIDRINLAIQKTKEMKPESNKGYFYTVLTSKEEIILEQNNSIHGNPGANHNGNGKAELLRAEFAILKGKKIKLNEIIGRLPVELFEPLGSGNFKLKNSPVEFHYSELEPVC